ncbi:permease [Longispora fulva]|uniref:Uncharacterized membrane protein YraQ (UPF0718 family) n=4 Tax=Longispora fulva TaxID=619741 RepID=A0A8J7GGP5_9ACTN|nr:uncharacterized membrane protein YraQ (UPF0718 family) [Longispora fulva]
MQTQTVGRATGAPPASTRRWSVRSVEVLAVLLVLAALGRGLLSDAMGTPRLQSWSTVFISIVIQAMPFVALGTLLSAAIAVFVPPAFFTRALPKNKMLAVPAAGIAGGILPGCECASVPVAGALVRRGVTPGAALAFLLSAPAINPVVMVSTYVAFPGQPSMVFARFGASLGAAVLMGWLWLRVGRDDWLRQPKHHDHAGEGKVMAFVAAARHDMTQAGGYLAIGAFAAATLNVTVPPSWLRAVADNPVLAVLALAVLAVVLSICSEADAFVAASLTQFSLTARLVFLVVGPMVDLKLFAMQVGAFGRRFALRFAPTTFVIAVLVAVGTGALLW